MGIYVYPANAGVEELKGTGLCGELSPISAEFEEIVNGMSEITMTLPIDQTDFGDITDGLAGKDLLQLKQPDDGASVTSKIYITWNNKTGESASMTVRCLKNGTQKSLTYYLYQDYEHLPAGVYPGCTYTFAVTKNTSGTSHSAYCTMYIRFKNDDGTYTSKRYESNIDVEVPDNAVGMSIYCTAQSISGTSSSEPYQVTFYYSKMSITYVSGGENRKNLIGAKHSYITEDCIISAPVPVCGAVGETAEMTERYTIKTTATVNQRKLWNHYANDDKGYQGIIPGGAEITIYAISAGEDVKRAAVFYVWQGTRYKGFVDMDAIDCKRTYELTAAADVPRWTVKDQYFRVYSIEKTLDNITVHARHITYDLMYNITLFETQMYQDVEDIPDTMPQHDSEYALYNILDKAVQTPSLPFSLTCSFNPYDPDGSAGETAGTVTYLHGNHVGYAYAGRDIISALLDGDDAFVKIWKARLVRDNFKCLLMYNSLKSRGAIIEYGKNMMGVTMQTDMSNLCTRLMPIGKDSLGYNIYLDENDGIIDSPLRDSYDFDHILTLSVDDAKVDDDVPLDLAKLRMREAALQAFKDGADKPTVTMSVDFTQLSDDARYKDFAALDATYAGDVITIRHAELGIDIDMQITHTVYDIISGQMLSVELGSVNALATEQTGNIYSGGSGTSQASGGGVSYVVTDKDVYSMTEEIEIGKWWTGAKIYRKMYDLGSVSGTGLYAIDVSPDTVVKIYGTGVMSGGYKVPFPSDDVGRFAISTDGLMYVLHTALTNCVVVIEYTKSAS